jgi:hypothetical protein
MRAESLLAHELMCLHLRSFCEAEACSPIKKGATRAPKKAVSGSSGRHLFRGLGGRVLDLLVRDRA